MQKLFLGLKLRGIIALSLTLFLLLFQKAQIERVTAFEVRDNVPMQVMEVKARSIDERTLILKSYLEKNNSPMVDSAQDFVDAADIHGVDWKLVPAISGVESTFGKHTPGNDFYPSYNAWGWGVYGTQALYFKSWEDGIFVVTEGLKKNYINRGLTNPYSMNKIYAASPTWGSRVSFFMSDLEKYAKDYKKTNVFAVNEPELEAKVSGESGRLANYIALLP